MKKENKYLINKIVLVEKAPFKVKESDMNSELIFYVRNCVSNAELIEAYNWLHGGESENFPFYNAYNFKDYFVVTKCSFNGDYEIDRVGQVLRKKDCEKIK